MEWTVLFDDAFAKEVKEFSSEVEDKLLSMANLVAMEGPDLGRPYSDTLSGSKFPNMKELRFKVGKGAWRVAYAFDPERQAILLVAGDKAGVAQKRFYKRLIAVAEERFSQHLKKESAKDA